MYEALLSTDDLMFKSHISCPERDGIVCYHELRLHWCCMHPAMGT